MAVGKNIRCKKGKGEAISSCRELCTFLELQGEKFTPAAQLIAYGSLVLKRWMVENLEAVQAWMDGPSLKTILPGKHIRGV